VGQNGSKRTYAPIMPTVQISGRFLSEDERVTIADRRAAGLGIRTITTELGRSPSTTSREIRRNHDPLTGLCHPYRAEHRARPRRARPTPGKLITGKNNKTAIGTLIERTTRFVVLLHLPDGHNAQQVRDALIAQFSALPGDVRRSLTWDQGVCARCSTRSA
jgi:IS30 family transposase